LIRQFGQLCVLAAIAGALILYIHHQTGEWPGHIYVVR
jgi:hypothetical protein